jgi:hypothetical protein
MAGIFPSGFEDLEPYAAWSQGTEFGRNKKRWTSTLAESQAFYDIMLMRAPVALEYLDKFPLNGLSPEQTNLLNLCLALAECAVTIEMYGEPSPKYVFPIDRFVPVHDTWPIGVSLGESPP